MTTKILLLFAVLPLIARADDNIRVNFWTSPDNKVLINATGLTRNTINDGDMSVFGITEQGLISGIRVISGATPNQVFLRDPTGTDDQHFAVNNWPPTNTILGVESYRLISSLTTGWIASRFNITNYTQFPTEFRGWFNLTGSDRVQNQWPRHILNKTGQNINYDFNLLNGKGKINFVSDWGRSSLYTQRKVLRANFTKIVNPQQRLRGFLHVTEGIVEAIVTYRAGLEGNAIGHFSRRHNGRHFWPYDINSAVRMGQQTSPRFRITEQIRYQFISEMNIELIFEDLSTEVFPAVMYDLEDNLIVNPTEEDIEDAKKININKNIT